MLIILIIYIRKSIVYKTQTVKDNAQGPFGKFRM